MRRRTFTYWAEEVLFLKKTKAKKTYIGAVNQLKHLLPFFGDLLVADITFPLVQKYIAMQQQRHRTVNDDIKIFNQVMRYALLSGENVRAMKIPKPDPKKGRGKTFTRSEIARLLWNSRHNRDLALQIRMAYLMGMRKSEICHFRWEFLNFDNGEIYLPPWFLKTKGTVDRAFFCNSSILRTLRRRRMKNKTKYLFPSPTKDSHIIDNKVAWQKAKRRAKVTGRFHDLRHTAITNMQVAGVPVLMIQKMLGVSSEVIRRYTHIPKYIAKLAVNIPRNKVA